MIAYTTSAETVYTVARQLNTSLDLDEVLGKVLSLTVDATGASRGSLFLLDEEGRVLRQILARPDQSPEVSERNVNTVMEVGLAGWVYRHQYGALAADTTIDERWVRLPDDDEITGSALVVPLLYQERINGLLALHHTQVRYFDESHLALAAGIAGQAAIALENARLFTEVKEERESLFKLINGMPIPVLVVDRADQVVLANQSARQRLPLKQVDVSLDAVTGGELLKEALEELRQRVDTRIEVKWPDGRTYNVSTSDVPKVGAVVAMDDITHLKELDAMKSQFVETVSHDLKNPLGVMLGFAQLLESEKNLSESGQASLQGIKRSGQHMQNLITDLLDLARIEAGIAGTLAPHDLVRVVLETLPDFALKIEEKNLHLTTDLPFERVKVLANKVRLSQIVSNYVGNAVKYSFAGGEIRVKLVRKDGSVVFSVTDAGPGIAPARQAQLFQKFYRVPEVGAATGEQGTGLGLSIVKAIVEGYGGRVWVESEVGQGSTFGCVLPIYPKK